MVVSPRVNLSFIVLIDLYIFLCQELSNANLVNNSIGVNGEQGNNIEQNRNAFRNISDQNHHVSGIKTSSSIISDNQSASKAKIGNPKFEIENT